MRATTARKALGVSAGADHQCGDSGDLFVFLSRRRDRAKILTFDKGGFVLWYKRLERGRFRHPRRGETDVVLDGTELTMLLDGIDLDQVRRPKHWAPAKRIDAGGSTRGRDVIKYQSIVGVDGELHLQPNPSNGRCALARGNDMLVMSEVREVSATISAKEAKGLQKMVDVRQAKAVDVGVPNCPAAYRGSLYDHLIVVGKSHIATFKVRYPKDEAGTQLGSDERKQLNEQRSQVSDKIAQGLGERLR